MKKAEIKFNNSYEILKSQNPIKIDKEYDYQITFRITESCNIKCEYCHWNNGKHYKLNSIINSIKKLNYFFNDNNIKHVLFYFHGGEAITHPDILEILKYIKQSREYNDIELQTNLVSDYSLIKNALKYISYLSISYHYLELINKEKHTLFINNYKQLIKENIKIDKLDIMLENVDSENLEVFYNYILYLLEYDNVINSEMIYGFCHYKFNKETSKKHMDFYKKYNKTEQLYRIDGKEYNTNDLFQKGIDCVGCKCEAGKYSIIVNGDGNVFNCGIHMTNYLRGCDDKPFMNLLSDSLKKLSILLKIGTLCKWDYCGGDFYLNRKR